MFELPKGVGVVVDAGACVNRPGVYTKSPQIVTKKTAGAGVGESGRGKCDVNLVPVEHSHCLP